MTRVECRARLNVWARAGRTRLRGLVPGWTPPSFRPRGAVGHASGGSTALVRSAATVRGVGRAFGGALLFAVPILLTMEMWSSAVTMPR